MGAFKVKVGNDWVLAPAGPKGDIGETGPAGPAGPTGAIGPSGSAATPNGRYRGLFAATVDEVLATITSTGALPSALTAPDIAPTYPAYVVEQPVSGSLPGPPTNYINLSDSASIQFTLSAYPDVTKVNYWDSVSSESFDVLRLTKNDATISNLGGSYGWTERSVSAVSTDTLKWQYVKDGSGQSGNDRAYIGRIEVIKTSSSNYKLNDLVTHNGLLYRCLADGATETPSDTSSSWALAVIASKRTWPFSKAGVLTVTTGTHRIYNDTGSTITLGFIRASVGTAPTGSTLTVVLAKNGVDLSTVNVAAGANTGSVTGSFSWETGTYLTVNITAVGSTVAGADLTVQLTEA